MNVAIEDYKRILGDKLRGLTEEEILIRMERERRLAVALLNMWRQFRKQPAEEIAT